MEKMLFIGILVCLLVSLICAGLSAPFIGKWYWIQRLVTFCPPTVIGGIFAGYVNQRQGWVYGLLTSIVFLVFLYIAAVWMFHWVETPWEILRDFISDLWLPIVSLLSGTAGGYVGQHLAHLYRKD